MRLFSNIRSIVLDAIAFARNLCRSRSALAAENLFLRKQLTFPSPLQASASRTIRSLYSALKRRRFAFSLTSGSRTPAAAPRSARSVE